jgi:hypothetical protein
MLPSRVAVAGQAPAAGLRPWLVETMTISRKKIQSPYHTWTNGQKTGFDVDVLDIRPAFGVTIVA